MRIRWAQNGAAVVAAAATVLFAVPTPAHAAVGTLYIHPHSFIDPPKGCQKWSEEDTVVTNHTDATVSFYTDVECFTNAVKIVHPGGQEGVKSMQSFLVWR